MELVKRPMKVLAAIGGGAAEILSSKLPQQDFDILAVRDGAEALHLAGERPDMMVLDWAWKEPSARDVCVALRTQQGSGGPPILMLTGGTEDDRIDALNNGADDCLSKPFSSLELLTRMRVLLRRMHPEFAGPILCFEDLEMDLAAHRVRRRGKNIALTPTNFRLLQYLLRNPAHVFSRHHLLKAVWGDGCGVDARTVDHHIQSLRRLLNAGGRKDLIRTVRHVGYSLDGEN